MILPKNFGKYDVVGVLGAGAMGTVYDAVDPVIGRRVAIKTVLKHSLDASEAKELLDRFKQEAQAAGRLNHPGVCSIYDYGETDYVSYIAMEYLSGKELKKYFDESVKFDLKEIVRIMSEILDALDHAHRNKVVHRDIKPANIMITDDGRVKVADFGVAKLESSMLTQVGTKVGTPAYMSPEQHKGLAVDGRSDLFSCGVILYQFLSGVRPFAGGSHTVAQEILTRTPAPPSEINKSLTPVWDAIAKKALAKRRDERYLTARDFIDALSQGLLATPGGVGVPYQTATRPPSESSGTASGMGSKTEKAERTNLAMESELEFWKEIRDSDIEEDFAAFVDSFPDGRFSHIAKRRLDKLRAASARSQAGEGALPAGAAVTSLAPGAPGQTRPDADEDRTLLSGSAAGAAGDAGQGKSIDAAERTQVEAAHLKPAVDVDATMFRPRAADAKAEPDGDATVVQKLDQGGVDVPGADDGLPDADGSDTVDFDLSDDAPASPPVSPVISGTPSAATVTAATPVTEIEAGAAEASPAQPAAGVTPPAVIQAEIQSAAEDASAPPPLSPVNSAAPATAAVTPAAPVTPVTVKEASPAPPAAGETPPAAIQPTIQSATVPAATAAAAAATATAPVVPKAKVLPSEEPQAEPRAKKNPVPVMAGVAVALVAAGAGWFMLSSGTAPSSNAPETAARAVNPAQTQENADGQRQQKGSPEKSVPVPSKGTDNGKLAEAKKANDAAEQKKAGQDAQKSPDEKAAAKQAADKASADKKLAADKAAADNLAADKAAADKLAADKAAADKQAADRAAADKLAADKAAADKAAADKLAAERVAAAASAGSIADRIAAATAPAELYKRAVALQSEGKASQAVALLRQASAQGHGPSSRLLAVIFTDGSGDVRANFREVDRYKALAEKQGER